MMKKILFFFMFSLTGILSAQEISKIDARQKAISSMSLVDAISTRVPGARKITDRMGNRNISLRGRQSFKSAGDEVIWEIDGIIYANPPYLNVERVKYVEVLSGLAATNKYGSQGAAGVVIVKTNVSAEKFNSRKNLWNRSSKVSKKKKKAKRKKKDKKS